MKKPWDRWMVFALAGALALAACSDDGSQREDDAHTEADAGKEDTGDASPDTADTTDASNDGQTDATADADASGSTNSCSSLGEGGEESFDHVYEVGPGQEYADPSEVPWESLAAGTLVRIHHRAQPYAAKWVINAAGTAEKPVVVRGVMDGDERPVITGEAATTRTALDFWNEDRGVVKIGGSSTPSGEPSYIRVENLEITGAHPSNTFVDDGGSQGTYRDNAAALYVEQGAHLTIRNCVLRGSGNGLFVTASASDVLVTGNHIYGNGIVGSHFEHNSYTESVGITFEYNHYGPLCDGCTGNNLKDRSAGTVVRYNWIESGNRQLDLVDSSKEAVNGDPSYRETFVYGNVLVEPSDAGNRQIVHYGGDGGDQANYRKGTLHFYHNTVVSERTDRNTLLRLSTDEESAVLRNNIVFAPESATQSIIDNSGQVDMAYNWLPTGWIDSFAGDYTGTVTAADNLTGAAPGFVDAGGHDYTLASDSPARGAAGPLDAQAMPVECQYEVHQGGVERGASGDLGAL